MLSPACLTNKRLLLTWELFSEHVLLDLVLHSEQPVKRSEYAPRLLGHRHKRQESTAHILLYVCQKKDLNLNPKLWEPPGCQV